MSERIRNRYQPELTPEEELASDMEFEEFLTLSEAEIDRRIEVEGRRSAEWWATLTPLQQHTKRARLAAYLREIADLIDADEVEVEPTAALVVISGPKEHEVVCCGYGDDDHGFQEAAAVAGYVARSDWCKTLGGNRRKRGDYIGRPMKHHNIVDGDFPSAARPSSPTTGGDA